MRGETSKRRGEGIRKEQKGRTDNERRDSLPATGGKDLGKLKGVAIDYLTRDGHEEDFGSRCGPDPDGPAGARRPFAELSVDRLAARYTEQKRGSMNPLSVYRMHARTHVIPPRIRARPFSVFVLGALPIFLYPYRRTRYERCRGNFGIGRPEKNLFESVKIGSQIENV